MGTLACRFQEEGDDRSWVLSSLARLSQWITFRRSSPNSWISSADVKLIDLIASVIFGRVFLPLVLATH